MGLAIRVLNAGSSGGYLKTLFAYTSRSVEDKNSNNHFLPAAERQTNRLSTVKARNKKGPLNLQ